MDDIDSRLKEHSSCFCSMVELIPAKFYLTKDPETVEDISTSKYWVNNKKHKAPKQSVKEATKRAKRMKLDPENQKSVLEQQKENEHSEKVALTEGEGLDNKESIQKLPGFSVELVRSTELSDLRERLKFKIESMRGKRKTLDDDPDQLAQKKHKRSEKKTRKKETQRRKKKRKAETDSNSTKQSEERPSIKAENGKIVFSKFDFSTPSNLPESVRGKKKDYRRLLAKAEATEKKLEELKKNDEKRGEELQEKLQWRKAMDLAKGSKVKDDPRLLKKTLKRLDSKKSKSRKYWNERQEQEQVQKDRKQEVRRKHIQERVEQIKARKNKRKVKKGKSRTPGF